MHDDKIDSFRCNLVISETIEKERMKRKIRAILATLYFVAIIIGSMWALGWF